MHLPIELPVSPMLAKSVENVPPHAPLPRGTAAGTQPAALGYEPKWDGFRCIVLRDGDEIELASRGNKPLTRYFPEVVALVREHLPERIALDCEIVVRRGSPGAQRLDWEALSARIHPAASRIEKLSRETPAELIAFDLLALGDESLMEQAFEQRREALVSLFESIDADRLHLTRLTRDPAEAQRWFEQFEGAGLDGIVAKPLDAPYSPGKRTMLKVKHKRTAEAVVVGYRVHKSGQGVGSLLLGLTASSNDAGEPVFFNVGGIVAFTAARRLELVEELAPLVIRDSDGDPAHAETDRSRFSSNKDVSFVPLRPERVVEVAFDQLEGHRFRHAVTFVRWRPDRDPASCTLAQIDVAPSYDLSDVLLGD